MTTTLGKIGGFIGGITVTLLSWLQYCAKGRKFVLGGVIAGIAIILLALFSKVSDTKRQKKN
jgi:Na+/proline symporter